MFQTKVVEKMKTHVLWSVTFSENRVNEIMWKKYGRGGQDIHDNIIWRMHFAYWVTKATDIHSEYVILLLFHVSRGFSDTPRC